MRTGILALVCFVGSGLYGCATTDSAIRDSTAGVLGVAPSDVRIEGLRSDSISTYYVAVTSQGEYACVGTSTFGQVLGGGLTNPPKCNKK